MVENVRGVDLPVIYIYMSNYLRSRELLDLIRKHPDSENMVNFLIPTEEEWKVYDAPFKLTLGDRVYKLYFKKEDKHD